MSSLHKLIPIGIAFATGIAEKGRGMRKFKALLIGLFAIAAASANLNAEPVESPQAYDIEDIHVGAYGFDLDPRASGYKNSNAYWLAVLSGLSYCRDFNAVKTALSSRHGFTSVKLISSTKSEVKISHGNSPSRMFAVDSQVLLAEKDDSLILAFRGTEPANFSDFATDFSSFSQRSNLGDIHSGFYAALVAIWKPLYAEVSRFQTANPGKPIWITGHSLGGALATLATVELLRNQISVKGLYTFGSPRVGAMNFKELFDKLVAEKGTDIERFVNSTDMVPRIPSVRVSNDWHLPGFYYHVGNLKYLDEKGNLLINPDIPENILTVDMGGWIDNHLISNYIAKLEKIYSSQLRGK